MLYKKIKKEHVNIIKKDSIENYTNENSNEGTNNHIFENKVHSKVRCMDEIKRFNVIKSNRSNFEQKWNDVGKYILPYNSNFGIDIYNTDYITDSPINIYTSHPENELKKTATALMSFTINPMIKWFDFELLLKYKNSDINESEEIKEYLKSVRDIILEYTNDAIASPAFSAFLEMLAFSTGIIYIQEENDINNPVSMIHVPLSEVYLEKNSMGKINKVYRLYTMTAYEIIDKFSKYEDATIPDNVIKTEEIDPLKKYTILQIVEERVERHLDKIDKKNRPYKVVYILKETSEVLYETGEYEFPYAAAQIPPIGSSTYGISPAMSTVHSIKALNKQMMQKLTAGDSALTPAFNVPIDTYINKFSPLPYALNYYSADSQSLASPVNTGTNFAIANNSIEDLNMQVSKGLLSQLVSPLEGDSTFVAQKNELLQLSLMSPWQAGLKLNFFDIIIKRVFGILSRVNGALPEEPEQLKNIKTTGNIRKIRIKYRSKLQTAANLESLQNIDKLTQFILATANIGSTEVFNIENTIREYAELVGVSKTLLRSKEELNQARQEQQAMQQQAMQQQQEQHDAVVQDKEASALNKTKDIDIDPAMLQAMMQQQG